MLKLSDFFQPLSPLTLLYFVLLFFFFDIVGTFLKRLILGKEEKSTRIINWLLGLSFFIFAWFILSFFIAYHRLPILISMGVLLLISFSEYIRRKEYLLFFREIWSLKLPLLIIIPFLPAVFVKASLPPNYADEMAYHFISPSTLSTLTPVKYSGGLYANLPRLLNVFFELMFSLTRTYSIVRLFHFSILVTSILYAFQILRKNFSTLVAFLFAFIFFSLPQDIVLTSTLGYVDVAAYSFLLIGVISAVDFLETKNTNFLILSATFWAMNLGTKYSGVTAFVSFLVAFTIFVFIRKKEYFYLLKPKTFLKIGAVFIVFGGYWYIKNLIVYGNPIYPFIFPCFEEFAKDCQTGGSFFGDWTMQVTLANAIPVLKLLFAKNPILQAAVVITPILAFLGKNKEIRRLTLFLLLSVLIELILLKQFSGFYIRYHQHLQLILLLALVIQFAHKFEKTRKVIIRLLLIGLGLSVIASYIYTLRYTNSLRFLNWLEINYSLGKIDIYGWIDWRLPEMKHVLWWCENPPEGKRMPLARFDPDLIWFEYAGYKRVFLTNCYYANPPLETIPIEDVLREAKKEKLEFWIASLNRCLPDSEVKPLHTSERSDMLYLRKLNNKIVCNAAEVLPNLYFFDFTKIKEQR